MVQDNNNETRPVEGTPLTLDTMTGMGFASLFTTSAAHEQPKPKAEEAPRDPVYERKSIPVSPKERRRRALVGIGAFATVAAGLTAASMHFSEPQSTRSRAPSLPPEPNTHWVVNENKAAWNYENPSRYSDKVELVIPRTGKCVKPVKAFNDGSHIVVIEDWFGHDRRMKVGAGVLAPLPDGVRCKNGYYDKERTASSSLNGVKP